MLHILKNEEPQFLTDFKKKHPKKDYDSEEFAQHRPVLKAELIKEQKGLCAYCCGRITHEKSHNEHIEPRNPGKYASNRSLDYTNIVASCNTSETCGNKRKTIMIQKNLYLHWMKIVRKNLHIMRMAKL